MSKLACLSFLLLSVLLFAACGGEKREESDINDAQAANVVAGAIAALNSGDSADVTITFDDYDGRPGSGTTSLRITGKVIFIDDRRPSGEQRVSAISPRSVRVEITLRPSNGTTYSF